MPRFVLFILACLLGCSETQQSGMPPPRPEYTPAVHGASARLLTARQDAVELEPFNANAWSVLGQTYFADTQYDAAVICFEQVVSLTPDDGTAWMLLAMSHEGQGDRDAARAAYVASTEAAESPPAASWRSALLHLDLGEPLIAVTLATDSLKRNQNSRMARLVLARAFLECERPRDAAGVLNDLVKAKPNDRYARLLFGRALQRSGRAEASSHLRLGQGAKPVWHDPWSTAAITHGVSIHARQAVAQALLSQRQYQRALDMFRQLSMEAPEQIGLQIDLAKALRSAGKLQEALDIVEGILESSPDGHAAHTQAAGVLFTRWQERGDSADLNRAIEHLDAAIALTETDGQNWMLRGEVRRQAGDLTGAASDFARAAEMMPHKPSLGLRAAEIYLQLGSPQPALAVLEQLRPDFANDMNLLILSSRLKHMAEDGTGQHVVPEKPLLKQA